MSTMLEYTSLVLGSLLLTINCGNGAVFCDNDVNTSSCANTTLATNTEYYCRGFMSCKDSTVDTSEDLYCQGDRSCKNTVYYNDNDDDLWAYGYQSADSLIMGDEAQNANCYGYQSCIDIIYQQYEDSGDNWNKAYGHGYQSLYGADIDYAPWVYIYGYQALYDATIDTTSLTNNVLNVYLKGYYASVDSDILCRSGQTCNIYAKGWYATSNTYIYCLAGSTCNTECGTLNGCDGLNMLCYSTATCYFNCSNATACPNEEDATLLSKITNYEKDVTYFDEKFDNIKNQRLSEKKIRKLKFKEKRDNEEKKMMKQSGFNNIFYNNNNVDGKFLIAMCLSAIIGATLLKIFEYGYHMVCNKNNKENNSYGNYKYTQLI